MTDEAPHITRMRDELEQLDDRIGKLSEFTQGATFYGLPEVKRLLMQCQLGAMKTYRTVLKARLDLELRPNELPEAALVDDEAPEETGGFVHAPAVAVEQESGR